MDSSRSSWRSRGARSGSTSARTSRSALRTVRSSAQCVVAERTMSIARALRSVVPCVLLGFAATSVHGQPVLRMAGQAVRGVEVDGSAAYPVGSLERLGFRVVESGGSLVATLDTDTLRFIPLSPFFQAGSRRHQLAYAPREVDGALHLPEQFFIQWLPN